MEGNDGTEKYLDNRKRKTEWKAGRAVADRVVKEGISLWPVRTLEIKQK